VEFNVPFQHKYGYVRDEEKCVLCVLLSNTCTTAVTLTATAALRPPSPTTDTDVVGLSALATIRIQKAVTIRLNMNTPFGPLFEVNRIRIEYSVQP